MENSPNGVEVTMVQNGSGADKAGLKVDDIILKIDGNDITSPAELAKSVSGLSQVMKSKLTTNARTKKEQSMQPWDQEDQAKLDFPCQIQGLSLVGH